MGTSEPLEPQATVYDFLDDWFGERFTSDVVGQVLDMPVDQVDALHANYKDWQPRLRPRPLAPGELRPHVWNSFQNVSHFSSGIKSPLHRDVYLRLLLTYCHGIAVPSELQVAFSHLIRHGRTEVVPHIVAQALAHYAILRDLAETGAVEWLEEPAAYEPQRVEFPDINALLEAEDVWSWPELDLGPSLSHGNAVILFSQAAAELLGALHYADQNAADLVLRHPFFERVFDLLLVRTVEPQPRSGAGSRLLESLVHVGLPDLRPPNWGELLAVRETVETFQSWRTALGDGLARATDLAGEDMDAVRAILRERLTPEAELVRRQVRQTSGLSGISTGIKNFGLAGVGAAAASHAGGRLIPALVASGATGFISGIAAHVGARTERRVGKALLAHYLTFTAD